MPHADAAGRWPAVMKIMSLRDFLSPSSSGDECPKLRMRTANPARSILPPELSSRPIYPPARSILPPDLSSCPIYPPAPSCAFGLQGVIHIKVLRTLLPKGLKSRARKTVWNFCYFVVKKPRIVWTVIFMIKMIFMIVADYATVGKVRRTIIWITPCKPKAQLGVIGEGAARGNRRKAQLGVIGERRSSE
jgi:hypothetical protein